VYDTLQHTSQSRLPSATQQQPPHTLHLSGVFVGGKQVLVRAQLAITQSNDGAITCLLKIAVRSDDPVVSQMVANCIQ
jgi:coatomer subunit gamma